MGMEFGTAFRAGRAISHGWWSFKKQWLFLFLGAFLAHCGEGGGGGGGGDPFGSSDGSDIDWKGDWGSDPGWDPSGALDAGHSALQQAGAALGLPALPFAIGGIGGVELAILTVIVFIVLFFVTVLWAFKCWWMPGYIRLQADTLRSGEQAENRLFSGADKFVPYAILTVVEGLIIFGVLGVAAVPLGIFVGPGLYLKSKVLVALGGVAGGLIAVGLLVYVGLGISLAKQALVLDDLGPVDALGHSWGLVDGNRADLFMYSLVMGLYKLGMVIAGLFMCLIGVFFTSTIADAVVDTGKTESYLLLTRPGQETDEWAVWTEAA